MPDFSEPRLIKIKRDGAPCYVWVFHTQPRLNAIRARLLLDMVEDRPVTQSFLMDCEVAFATPTLKD